MPSNQANFNLHIGTTADLKGINELKTALEQVKKAASNPDLALSTKEILDASKAANTLEQAMTRAYDVKLNTINISQFNKYLKESGMSLKDIQQGLSTTGVAGQQAFMKAANSLMTMNTAMKQSSGFLDKMAKSISNTVRYQVLNSAFRSITGSISEAYGYVKNLDKSLNAIQIVTEKSTDSMKEFAKEANSAAQSLGAKTTDYTDASLIYYQQGLSDEEVAGRTDTTIKMANVLGESASEVSDYMTAIWNNFDDGSKSLEYFGDVITNLGANTASSAAEIAEGLGKFAAVADTVGLSYEYATAALATVVAETRQSADTVGTAFKTLFARIQDLELGDEGSVSLGKYAQALEKVGINILDANGNMKNMDELLDEMGSKWNSLSKAQQTALAQNVAGTRQYTQLVALMENWDEVKQNIDLAGDSIGTLEDKQAIYMQSTAAHLKTMKAAWENFFDSMLQTDTINDLADASTNIANILANVADSVGGLIPLLGTLGATGLRVFSGQIANGLSTVIEKITLTSNLTRTYEDNLKQVQMAFGANSWTMNESNLSETNKAILADMVSSYEQLQQAKKIATEEDYKQYEALQNNRLELGKLNDTLSEELTEWDYINRQLGIFKSSINSVGDEGGFSNLRSEFEKMSSVSLTLKESIGSLKEFDIALKDSGKTSQDMAKELLAIATSIEKDSQGALKAQSVFNDLGKVMNKTFDVSNLPAKIEVTSENLQAFTKILEKKYNLVVKTDGLLDLENKVKNTSIVVDDFSNKLNENLNNRLSLDNIVSTVGALGQLAMSMQMIKNIGSIWNNDDLSTGDKILQTVTNLSFVLPQLIGSISKLTKAESLVKAVKEKNLLLQQAENANYLTQIPKLKTLQAARLKGITIEQLALKETQKEIISRRAQGQLLDSVTLKEIYHNKIKTISISLEIAHRAAILATVAVLSLAVAGVIAYNKHLEEERKKTIENAQAKIEEEKAIQDEIKSHKKLYEEYHKTLKLYEDHIATKEEMHDITKELCDAYNLEDGYLATLTGDYKELTQQIDNARLAEIERAKQSAVNEQREAEKAVTTTAQSTNNISLKYDTSPTIQRSEAQKEIWNDLNSIEGLGKNLSTDVVGGQNNVRELKTLSFSDDKLSAQDLIALYNRLFELRNEWYSKGYTEENYYKEVDSWLTSMKTSVEELESVIENSPSYLVEEAAIKAGISNVSTYKELLEVVNKLSKNSTLNADDINEYLKSLNTEYTQTYFAIDELAKKMATTKFGNSEEELKNWINNLSEEDRQILLSGKINFDGLETTDNLRAAIDLAKRSINPEELSVVVSLNEHIRDKKLSKSEYKDMMENESILSSEYGTEMASYSEQSQLKQSEINMRIVADKKAKNEEYIKNEERFIADQKDLLDEQIRNLEKAQDEYTARITQLSTKKNRTAEENEELERLQNALNGIAGQLDEVAKAKSQLDDPIEVFAQLEDLSIENLSAGVDTVITRMEILQNITDNIGENFTIAADKVHAFGEAFPEIIANAENYNILQDGSLQLTKEATEAALAKYKTEITANTELYKQELERNMAIKQAEIDYYDQQIANLESYLNAEIDENSLESKMAQGLTDYKNELSKIEGVNNAELNRIVQENSGKTADKGVQDAQDIFNAWVKVGEAAAAASKAYNTGEMTVGEQTLGRNSSGANTVNYEGKDTSEMSDELATYRAAVEASLEEFKKARAEASGELATMGGQLADLLTKGSASLNSLDNALSGKGNSKSSSSSKEKQTKDTKKYDDEFDRYHDLKKSIDALADAMSDLDKRQSHLFGKELAASLKQSNQLIQQQRSNYEALASAQRAEMGEIQGDLGAMGVAFDSTTGQITNYAEATTRALAELNAAIETFNNSAQTAADKKLLEAAEKNYEEFKKKLERYDNLVEQVRDTENKLDDLWYKEKENNLKAWEAVIDVSLDLEEAEREWQKFVNEMNTDFKGVFKDIKGEMKTLADEVSHLIKPGGTLDINENAMSDIEREIDKMMAGGESDMFVSVSEAQEKLKEYMSAYQDNVESIFEAYKQGWEDYVDGIDQAIGKFDDLIKQYEKLNDELDHQNKLIELLYGDEAYDYLNSLYDAQANNLLGEMNSLSTQVKFYEQMFHDASEKWGADSQAANEWKEAWENALSELHDKEEEYLQDIQNLAINMVNKIADELGKKLTGGMGLDKAREQWDDAMAAADGYYDEVQRIYQLETLQGKYQDLIDNTSNVSDQQKIKAIMDDQLATLGDKNKLSETDIELAEKRLQVLQAQIDLENAQNNKNSMKVTRGEDGNWSYQYVADEGDVADKQQNLLDKLNEWRTATKEAYLEFTELGLSLEEQYVERFTEISQDLTLTDEERQAKLEYLYEYYYGDNGVITAAMQESNYLERELNQATAEELWGLYQADADKFTERNDKEIALIEQLTEYGIDNYLDLYNVVTECYDEIKDKCNEVNEESVEGWTSAAAEMARVWNSDDGDSVRTAVMNAMTDCQKVLEDYSARVDAGSEAAQEDLRNVESAINRVEEATDSLRGATNELINETISELTEYENYLRQLEQAWYSVKDRAMDAMNTAIEYLRKTAQEAMNTINAITQAKIAAANAVAAAQSAVVRTSSTSTKTSSSSNTWWTQSDQVKYYDTTKTNQNGQNVIAYLNASAEEKARIYKNNINSAYATGGYTGNWNGNGDPDVDDGKLAWLHQKELVLNATDTENILSVVDIVRQISSGLQDRLSSLGSLFAGGGAPGSVVNNNDAGNVFNITAEFPNANDVDEIREAILSLPNLASQYLGR